MATATSTTGLTAGPLRAVDGRSRRRIFRNSFWSVLCVALSFLTLVPLFSIVYLVLQKGLPLLNLQVFTQLPPAPGLTGGGFGNAIQGTTEMVLIALLL
jgi:phosphate transport system permease protein